jgi:hypothetical protein
MKLRGGLNVYTYGPQPWTTPAPTEMVSVARVNVVVTAAAAITCETLPGLPTDRTVVSHVSMTLTQKEYVPLAVACTGVAFAEMVSKT